MTIGEWIELLVAIATGALAFFTWKLTIEPRQAADPRKMELTFGDE